MSPAINNTQSVDASAAKGRPRSGSEGAPAWLAAFEPRCPINELVVAVNTIYHAFSAEQYDRDHPEIHEQLPPLWKRMIACLPERSEWCVLDFGCGTGFEAAQVLPVLEGRLRRLVAYDPSIDMLARCKDRLRTLEHVTFSDRAGDLAALGPYNLLLTNSLLHHLPDVAATMRSLLPLLDRDAYWLAGHEPSARFYRNPACSSLASEFGAFHDRRRSWMKYVEPKAYLAKLRAVFGLPGRDPLTLTAIAAHKAGLFGRVPPASVIDLLVDFHVAHSSREAMEGRGLDVRAMQDEFRSDWSLTWLSTYSYFGHHNPMGAPADWKVRAASLANAFPDDGAMFCAVWTRVVN